MITAIELENFRGFGKPVRIELAPITLLFGANSSGKSTVLQALLFVYEMFISRKESPETSILGGRYVNFGNFSDLVFSGNQDNKIRIKIELSFDWEDGGLDWSYRYSKQEFSPKKTVSSVAVEISLTSFHNRCRLCSLTFFAGEKPIVNVDYGDDHRGDFEAISFGLVKASVFFFGENDVCPDCTNWDTSLTVVHLNSKIPDGGYFLQEEQFPEAIRLDGRADFFVGWVTGISDQLLHHLKEVIPLGPLREVPVDFVPRYQYDPNRVSTGLSAWDDLSQFSPNELRPINKWMGPKGLDLGYQLKAIGFVPLESEQSASDIDISVIPRWNRIQDQNSGKVHCRIRGEIVLVPIVKEVDEDFEIWLRPCAVGVGVSQIVPVIYHSIRPLSPSAFAKRMVLIEQPEIHLHPRAQTRLGDLFIEGFSDSQRDRQGRFITSKQVLLETHSEHLMLRMLRRIRETGDQARNSNEWQLEPDQLAVNYFHTSKCGVIAKKLRVDVSGEFIDRWPDGFFDERFEELF